MLPELAGWLSGAALGEDVAGVVSAAELAGWADGVSEPAGWLAPPLAGALDGAVEPFALPADSDDCADVSPEPAGWVVAPLAWFPDGAAKPLVEPAGCVVAVLEVVDAPPA